MLLLISHPKSSEFNENGLKDQFFLLSRKVVRGGKSHQTACNTETKFVELSNNPPLGEWESFFS